MVLASAQGHSNAHIARELEVSVDTVRLWRDRWVGLQGIDLETLTVEERLQDAPRPGTPPKFTNEQRCQMAAFACEAPLKAGRPISQWTGREIADELVKRGNALADLATTCELSAQKRGLQPHRFRYWLSKEPDRQQRREDCRRL